MKKTYLQPEMTCLEIRDHQTLMSNTEYLPVYDGGNSGTPDPNDDVEDFEDLLAKPTTLYDVWEDEDDNEESVFHFRVNK